jgi:pseudouridylate synthase
MKPIPSWLDVHPEVAAALRHGRPVVALESSLIAQGLPWPHNLKAARMAEGAIRGQTAVPATIAVIQGKPTIGLSDFALEDLAKPDNVVLKLSRRDLAAAIVQSRSGGTTVAATMYLAHCAGIRVFATGGIGGVHRPSVRSGGAGPASSSPLPSGGEGPGVRGQALQSDNPSPPTPLPQGERGEMQAADEWDVSADLHELSQTPVAVVCSGAKNILDIPRTLEMLESLSVPVIGYGSDDFPGFYIRSSGQPVPMRVDKISEAANILAVHWHMDGGGVVLAQPVPAEVAISSEEFAAALATAEALAAEQQIHGPRRTPFLLHQLGVLTKEKTLRANISLVVANARLAARLATELANNGYH